MSRKLYAVVWQLWDARSHGYLYPILVWRWAADEGAAIEAQRALFRQLSPGRNNDGDFSIHAYEAPTVEVGEVAEAGDR